MHCQGLSPRLQAILDKHSQVFEEELGTIHRTTATLHVEENKQPVFQTEISPTGSEEESGGRAGTAKQRRDIEAVTFSD